MKAKTVLKAGIKKLLLFADEAECEKHLRNLRDRKRAFKILERRINDDDTVTMVIVEDYNGVELLI